MGSSLISEKFVDVRIGDSYSSCFGLGELNLGEIGSRNHVFKYGRIILEVLKGVVLVK